MLPPGFYNQVDKDIYAAGDFFIPQERFRAAPYNVNQPNNPDEVPAGIPTVYQPQGSGGGGGYTGGISDLTTGFFDATSNRQDRLRSLNMPLEQKGVPGGDILMENLQGYVGKPDDYLGIEEYNEALQKYSGMEGPQTIKGASGVYSAGAKPTFNRKVNDFIYDTLGFTKPQSADQILEEGYNKPYGSGGLGILGTILGKMDNYSNLPVADQAFIAKNMGYTGPTVFGANDSGLSKDPFGLNTRSAFGNYAERVGVESEKLGDALSATGAIGGKKDYQGATFNAATGMFEADDDSEEAKAAAIKANQMTKMVRAKYNFYTKQNQDYADTVQKAAEIQAAKDKDIVNKIGVTADDVASTTTQGGGGGIASSAYGQGGGKDAASMGGGSQQAKSSGGAKTSRSDGGWGWADGGRVYYMDGGLADMLEIYD